MREPILFRRMGAPILACVLLGATGVTFADPDGPQRLRGLEGRTFAVDVANLAPECFDADPTNDPDDCNFFNCYSFLAEAVWDDPLFPTLGTWEQHSTGAATPYNGTGSFQIVPGVDILLDQNGFVTPANGGGVLQLDALSDVILVLGGAPVAVLATYHSVGEEISAADALQVCPQRSD